jgi:hemerythrin
MPLVEWDNELSVGIRQIDEHHQHLVSLLNKAHESFVWGSQVGDRELIINELIDYASYHFSVEEELMKNCRYTGLEAHQKEHGNFITKIREIQYPGADEDIQGHLDIVTFLLEWLIMHIKVSDRAYCACLAGSVIEA